MAVIVLGPGLRNKGKVSDRHGPLARRLFRTLFHEVPHSWLPIGVEQPSVALYKLRTPAV